MAVSPSRWDDLRFGETFTIFQNRLHQLRESFERPTIHPRNPKGFVADPFVISDPNGHGAWLFFEEFDGELGRIGVAHSSDSSAFTVLESLALDRDPMHTSYPQVFFHGDTAYLHVESGRANGDGTLRLYSTSMEDFPFAWQHVGDTLTPGRPGAWDSRQSSDANIIDVDDELLMLYSGADTAVRHQQIGLAVNTSGSISQPWTRANGGAPIAFGKRPSWAAGHVRLGGSSWVTDSSLYFMCQVNSRYSGSPYSPEGDLLVGVGVLDLAASRDSGWTSLEATFAPNHSPRPLLSPWESDRWDDHLVHHLTFTQTIAGVMVAYDGCSGDGSWRIAAGLLSQ